MATPAAPEPTPDAPSPARADGPAAGWHLSAVLAALNASLAEREFTLHEVIQQLRGRAYLLLVILLALPFITPIPLPGLSTPFGFAIAFIAARLALGRRPWLPKKILRRRLPPGFFGRVLRAAHRIVRWMEKGLRPRGLWLTHTELLRRAHAALMLAAALVLLLPIPIPFTNSFPAWTILLLAGGLLERDGLAILGGYLVFALGAVYFFFLGDAVAALVLRLTEQARAAL